MDENPERKGDLACETLRDLDPRELYNAPRYIETPNSVYAMKKDTLESKETLSCDRSQNPWISTEHDIVHDVLTP